MISKITDLINFLHFINIQVFWVDEGEADVLTGVLMWGSRELRVNRLVKKESEKYLGSHDPLQM